MNVKIKSARRTADEFDWKSLGRRLRELRGFNVTQDEFASRLGISQSQLSKYERGIIGPSADVLVRIKKIAGISIDWLLTGDKD
jgi:transcriptional regulator with XRE-family HTH domain